MDTKVNGNDDTVKYKGVLKNIPVGEYIVKETKAPKGYTLDNKEYTINVKASTTETANTQLNLKENPICWQTDILIRKISENNIPISNAEFTIKFYKGYFTKSEIENGSADSSFKRFWKLKSDINGEVKLEGSHLVDSNNDFYYSNSKTCLPLGTITIQETKAPNGFVKDDTLYVQQIKPNASNTEVQIANIRTIINTPNTYYELVRTSDSGVVANMKFKIYRGDKVDENKYWKTVITDTSGKISEKIEIGTYTFDEISGDDYEKPEPKTITVTAENTRENPAVISFRNISKDGHLKICKTSNDGNIANISFEIYNTSNELVGRYTTDENGLIVKDIAPGTYRIHEIIPEGYAHISDQTVEVKANRTRQVTFRNVKTGYKIQIIKDTDFYDAGPFTCKIEGLSNNIELSVEIDTFEPTILTLEKGKYRITELLTEDEKEYWVADEPQEFIVDDTDELITVTVKNHEKTGKVKVIKTASDKKVDNLQFSLYGISNAGYEVKYRYATTDKDGIAMFDNIPVGTYTLEEISSHSIYEVTSSTDMNAILVEWNNVTEVKITNDEKKTPFEIYKSSDTGEIEGFKFEITGTNTAGESVKLSNLITDSEGKITGNLYPEIYTIRETEVPEKYITPESQTITIEQTTSKNPTPIQLFFENKVKRGSLKVVKTAYDNYIENISFSLVNKENLEEVYYSTTNENGVAMFENIPIGEYVLREENIGEQYVKIGEMTVNIKQNEITEKTVENKPKDGYFKIVKTSDTAKLDGFEFKITGTTWNGENIDITRKTNANGVIIDTLPTGSYTLEEINVPKYFVKPKIQKFEIEPYCTADKPYEIDIHNKLKYGKVEISKISEDGKKEGFVFHLDGIADCGETISLTAKTDSNGKAVFENVLLGTYSLTEDKVKRYVEFEPVIVNVTENEKTYSYNVKNKLDDVPVKVVKTSDYGVVQGVKIRVESIETGFDKTFTTDSKGQINARLHPGNYTFTELEIPNYSIP